MKEQKGITLVALVITIIVLLILAGVSLSIISGDDGILTNASKAKDETAASTAKEAVAMKIQTLMSEYYEGVYVSNTISSDTYATVGAYITDKMSALSTISGYTISVSGTTIELSDGDLKDGQTVTGTLSADGSLSWD